VSDREGIGRTEVAVQMEPRVLTQVGNGGKFQAYLLEFVKCY
jgi:hypothetical protein